MEFHMEKTWVVYLLCIKVLAFGLFGADKWKARHKKYRIRERTLLLAAVIGGSVGALCGMYFFRHKTLHRKFRIGLPAILFLQAVITGFLVVGFPAS